MIIWSHPLIDKEQICSFKVELLFPLFNIFESVTVINKFGSPTPVGLYKLWNFKYVKSKLKIYILTWNICVCVRVCVCVLFTERCRWEYSDKMLICHFFSFRTLLLKFQIKNMKGYHHQLFVVLTSIHRFSHSSIDYFCLFVTYVSGLGLKP